MPAWKTVVEFQEFCAGVFIRAYCYFRCHRSTMGGLLRDVRDQLCRHAKATGHTILSIRPVSAMTSLVVSTRQAFEPLAGPQRSISGVRLVVFWHVGCRFGQMVLFASRSRITRHFTLSNRVHAVESSLGRSDFLHLLWKGGRTGLLIRTLNLKVDSAVSLQNQATSAAGQTRGYPNISSRLSM